ncbi:hypothetical protein CONCODRAFT_14120 [Conidiobolus coronatus NRRL 28638]|uniref:RNI-like protein n=1 Tax=Conidiobolus coronatus (strain ATCC 28846 / CBS 209.66 / NRRL 28638) TaxID=796925 RepID=A0A137NPL3_CONC2|nr:hypothetical protein CONCODRAFT_14120 [Conidiobolus coronatus NRRL 28638]|eukprot:KXN64683.1 hypothetical protein CONCODRAFT_14120 [Conidiobolus coronatus NRRL 28638]
MEGNDIKQIKWESILTIPEFNNLLNIYSLKELSLLCKSFRLKLVAKLFETIQLDGEKFASYLKSGNYDLICGYFSLRNYPVYYSKDGELRRKFNRKSYEGLAVGNKVKKIELKLGKFKYHVKSFRLDCLDRAGYYLLPTLNIFPNLTTLNLTYCTISLDKFSELLSNLKKLNCLELYYISFAVLPTQEPTLNNLKFPQKLEKLIIFGLYYIKIAEAQTAFDFLFENLEDEILAEAILPPTHILSLKNFDYYGYDRNDNGLNRFLENNYQLEYLSLESNFIDSRKLELISKSSKLKKLTIRCEEQVHHSLNFSALTSITKLRFYNVTQEYLSNLEIICLSCTNLNNLKLIFDIAYEDVPQTISIIIARIISKSNYLSAFGLSLRGDYQTVVNFTELNNVTSVRIQASLDFLYYLDFANSERLSKVEFYWKDIGFDVEISYNELKVKFDNYNNWRFIYGDGLIKGKRVINKN